MILKMEKSVEDNCLILTAEGSVDTFEQYDDLNIMYVQHILESGKSTAVVDERGLSFKPSLLMQLEVVDSYHIDFPEEVLKWKVAVVSSEVQYKFQKHWEYLVQEKGLNGRVFLTLDEAKEFISAEP